MTMRCGKKLWTGVVTAACSLSVIGLAGCTAALAGDGVARFSSTADRTATSASSQADHPTSSSADVKAAASSEAGTWRDGTYYASGQGGKFGNVPVTVTIQDGRIASITLGANSETEAMAEKARSVVVPQILSSQSTEDVDGATGATMTSDAIVDGVARALERAAR